MASSWFQNAQRLIAQVFDWLQVSSQDRTADILLDTFTSGIDNATGIGEGFTIIPGSNNTSVAPSISVTTGGIAYDSLANRIYINPSDTTLYNPSNVTITTSDGIGNFISTPQSTGVVNIPLTQTSLNYLWVNYLQTVNTAVFTLNGITSAKQFYEYTDGYNITVTTVNIPPNATSIFLGTIDMTGGGAVQFSNISQLGRTYYSILPKIVPITTPFNNGSNRTPSYNQNTTYTLDAHIKAIGTGPGVSPTNPHNTSLADLGVSVFDTVQEHRILEHGNAIIAGTTITPYPTTSAMATIINVVNPGSDYLTVKQLLSSEFAIINGSAYTTTQIFGTIPADAQLHFPTTPGSSGVYNVYWDSVVLSFGLTTGDISADNTKLWIATVTWTLTGAFTINTITDGTHLIVSSTTGMNSGDTITQGANSTTITTVTDSTHLVVGSTVGFTTGNALDISLHNSLTFLTDRRRIGSTSHLMERWITSARPPHPLPGDYGYNLDTNQAEIWNGSGWTQVIVQNGSTTVTNSGIIIGGNTTGDSGYGTITSVTNSHYYEGTFPVTFTGPFTASQVVNYTVSGRVVTISVTNFTGTSTAATSFTTGSGVIPLNLRPAQGYAVAVAVFNAGVIGNSPGTITVGSSGDMNVFVSLAGGSFGGVNTVGLAQNVAFSWQIGL